MRGPSLEVIAAPPLSPRCVGDAGMVAGLVDTGGEEQGLAHVSDWLLGASEN